MGLKNIFRANLKIKSMYLNMFQISKEICGNTIPLFYYTFTPRSLTSYNVTGELAVWGVRYPSKLRLLA